MYNLGMPKGRFRDQRAIEDILSRSISAQDLAVELDVAVGTVYRWLDTQDDIPVLVIRTGPRRVTPFFPDPEIFEWFKAHESRRRGPK